jgi:C-terminal processing protease CtpA/Prc
LEGVGIEPDMPVEITRDDVVQHHDVELEKAIEYLTSQ